MYQFDENISPADKEFWGVNRGLPMEKPVSRGMIDGKNNILEYPCKEIGRTVPFFEELPKENGTMNEFLLSTINTLHDQEINLIQKNFKVKHLEQLPDGGITV